VVQGGKADGKDPLREARGFTEAEWRKKFAFVAGDPRLIWPEKQWGPVLGKPGCLIPEALQRELIANHPKLNRGPNQCTA
jgi:hypothetical protein